MKIAVCGKGGVGKSLVSGTLARLLARRGWPVVAVDADPFPNLGISLGTGPEVVAGLVPILNGLDASGFTHDDPVPSTDELLVRFGVDAPDGIRLVATGRIERPASSCMCCGSHTTTRRFFGDIEATDRVVVADLEAGLSDLIWANPGSDDTVVLVSDGSAKAIEMARRAQAVAAELGVHRVVAVANRTIDPGDLERTRGALGGAETIVLPEDPAVARADATGQAVVDLEPGAPVMLGIEELARRLVPEAWVASRSAAKG